MKSLALRLLLLTLLYSIPSLSLPKFASRTGASCQSCHVNPTGHGMRSELGRTYGRDDITLAALKDSADFDDFPVALTPYFSIGGDYRTLYYYDGNRHGSTFFQMQGNLYFDFRLNKLVRVYFDKGLYSGSFELFGLAKVLPLDGTVKVGKFLPAYGTRIDDHNAFIRGGPYGGGPIASSFPRGYPTGLPFGERAEDTGIELGIAPGHFTFSAGLFNGTPQVDYPVTPGPTKSVALRGDTRFSAGGAHFSFGGSLYITPSSTQNTYYGAFAAATLFETLTWTGEVDFIDVPHPGAGSTTGMMIWNELNYMILQGLDLKASYDFYDPDRNLQNGTFAQITLGAEFFVLPGVELRPLFRRTLAEVPPSLGGNAAGNQYLILTHFFF